MNHTPLVVKVGGSLFDISQDLVPVFQSTGRPLLIVPGGGAFADSIRNLPINNDSAHWMAICAMEQYGWYLHSFGLPITETLEIPDCPKILLPYKLLKVEDPLPHSWDVTSDTIAAWVAANLNLDLLLLKSVDGIFTEGRLLAEVTTDIKTETVDPYLIPFVLQNRVNTIILNARSPGRVGKFFQGENVPITRITLPR